MLESRFQKHLINDIKALYPDCIILKNDANYIQGFPDLLVLYKDKWACFEVKKCKNAHHQPNQDFYISKLSEWSYVTFVYPENEEEVLDGLCRTFGA